ncbi:hypothetical protein [Streptomyces sp. NPDC003717]|uniref:hypothetical protein n=1 Tax=Streptomyces sp. NPDC003717 TaxID=3154276 RepID=UPI0033A94A76
MPADEVTRGTDVEASRVRTGPRHAAAKKPLFTRFHVPAGKAIALAAMPTAVLMGMGFTPTLALADGGDGPAPKASSLTVDEYKACVEALKGDDASESPKPSDSKPSASESASGKGDAEADQDDKKPETGTDASPDSGSDDAAQPAPEPTASSDTPDKAPESKTPENKAPQSKEDDSAPAPSPSASASDEKDEDGGLLGDIGRGIGDAVGGLLGGGKKTESPSPTPSASATGDDTAKDTPAKSTGTAKDTADTAKDTAPAAKPEPKSTASADTLQKAKEALEKADKAAKEEKADKEAQDKAAEATPSATPSATPDPSESPAADPEDCPVATEAEGGVDNKIPLPDDPWYLNASSLTLKGADYKGVVEVRTADGTVKKVLKYVISNGTDIGDLHQTVNDKQSGKTYHVQAAKGSKSTITDGDTVMYTESISGNLLGLIPITFDPDNPPPLNIPLIYFTKVKVVQAGQFGGTLHIPGLHQYTTD